MVQKIKVRKADKTRSEAWITIIDRNALSRDLGRRASVEEAGDRLFTFTRLPPNQWRSARTTNAIERLHEEFKRRIETRTVLPSGDTAAMLFLALLASSQINMRTVDCWQTLATKLIDQPIDLAA